MNRAVLPVVLIVSAAMVTACVEEKSTSADGVVKVKVKMCATPKACPARLGFVVDKNHVLAYVGDTGGTDAAGKFSIKMAIAGWLSDASRVRYNKETGLALLKIEGEVKPVYEFALEPVEKARAVHAVMVIDGGHVPLVRGVVTAAKRHINTMDDDGIVHNALVGEAGYGSPLFNNCGEVVGVVVPAPSVGAENQEGRRMTQILEGQLAVPTAWLEDKFQFENRKVTLRKAVSACASERTQLIRAMKLDVLFWILLVGAGAAGATVAFLVVTARNDVSGGRPNPPPPSDGRQETDSGSSG